MSISDRQASVKAVPHVWIPDGFDPTEALPPKLWPKADCAKWFLGTIVRKNMQGRVDNDGFVRLSSPVLRGVMGQRTWPQIKDSLADNLITRPHVGGLRCRGYQIVGLGGGAVRVPLYEPRLVEQLNARRQHWQRNQEGRLLPIHLSLRAIQQRSLTVDSDIDEALKDLPSESAPYQGALVRAIRENRMSFTVSGTGRVFNAISGLKRALRQHVRLDGEPIGGVDIRAAQPALLSALLLTPSTEVKGVTTYNKHTSAGVSAALSGSYGRVSAFYSLLPDLVACVSRSDALSFADLASDGSIYEFLLEASTKGGVSVPVKWLDDPRRWVKNRFLIDVLNCCPTDYVRPVARVFGDLWPTIFSFIQFANSSERKLIAGLQRFESWLVIEQVAPMLVERIPIVTLHDAVYSRVRDLPIVREAFEETFERLNLPLALKEEV